MGAQKGPGHHIHTTNMGMEKIFKIRRITPYLSIKVNSSGIKASMFEDNKHSLGDFKNICRKLIGIPPILIIAPVGINAAEHIRIGGYLQFMLKRMFGKDSMVHFNIDFKIILQAEFIQETDNCSRIKIILMFGWL